MSTINRRRRLLGSALALGVTAAGLSLVPGVAPQPAAHAATGGGSIVYIKDYNVWLTDGDGSVHQQVTTGGTPDDPWQSPSESDAGVVVAHHSGLIYRMNQKGEVFNVIDPPALPDSYGNRLEGRDLTETAISPDGTKIAYTYYKYSFGEPRWVTAFTAAGQLTDFNQYGLSFYDKPSWVTNSRVLLNHWFRNKVHLYDFNVTNHDVPWFEEGSYTSDRKELSDLEVSRDGRWTVATRGDASPQSIIVLSNNGDVFNAAPPAAPSFKCLISDAGGLREPTIAPDGSTFAWTEATGIYRVSDMNCLEGSTRTDILVAAGGSDPSWSAAVVGQTPDVPDKPGATKPFTVSKKPGLKGKAVAGKVLAVRKATFVPKPQSVSYRWIRDGKAIPKATKSRYRVTKKDRGHKIAVKVTAKRKGWKATVVKTKAVRVKR